MKRLIIILIALTLFSLHLFTQVSTQKISPSKIIITNNLFIDEGANCLPIIDSATTLINGQQLDRQITKPILHKGHRNQINNRSGNIKYVPVSRNPEQVIITKDNLYAFVRCFLSNTVEIVDIASGEIINSLIIPIPRYMTISNDSTKLYVASFMDGMIIDPPLDDCDILGFWGSGKTLLTTIDISRQDVVNIDTIYMNIIRKILQPKVDSILYLVGNDVLEFNLNSHNVLRHWEYLQQINYSEIDSKNNKIFIAVHEFNGADSLHAIDLHSGIISKVAFYPDETSMFPGYMGIDTTANRLFMQGKLQPYSEVLVFNTVTLDQLEPLQNVSLFYRSFLADPELGSIFLTKAVYEYPFNYNTIELDYLTLELKKELPTPLTNSWKTILYNKTKKRLYSFQKGGSDGVATMINPPANLDLIEYKIETGEIEKYITTDHTYGCCYARSMAITTDGNTLIITNSPDNSISIVDLTVSNIEENKPQYCISLFPNPAVTYLQISFEGIINKDYNIEIYGRTGQKMESIQKSKHETEFNIDISKLPKGQYFIRFCNSEFSYTSKFQKM